MYGLIGKKLSHSFSADFFNAKFKREGLEHTFRLFPIASIEEFLVLIKDFPLLKGLNVTIPYKQEVIPFLHDLSAVARKTGAVNVIKILRHGNSIHLKGYNTDVTGFEKSLLPCLQAETTNALVLGTGGASKAVEFVLNKSGITPTFVSRTPQQGQLSYEDIDETVMKANKLIVNTTPLGMCPDIEKAPPIPYEFITSAHLCYDLIYNPDLTQFLRNSSAQGAQIKNGKEMLEIQALASWQIWNS